MQLFFDVFDRLLLPPRTRRTLARAERRARATTAARTRIAARMCPMYAVYMGMCVWFSMPAGRVAACRMAWPTSHQTKPVFLNTTALDAIIRHGLT